MKPGRNTRILIIDDEDFADIQAEYLKDQGYETTAEHTVESAEERLKDSGSEVDIALVDMYMGQDKKAGLELVNLMSEQYPWIVSVVVTGHGGVNNAVLSMQAGAFSYIEKGESPQALITETVKKAVAYGEKFPARVGRDWASDLSAKVGVLQRALHGVQEVIQRAADEVSRRPR
jgi:DNA-binding NtrC family response regulator